MTSADRAILAAAELPWQQREAVATRLGMSTTRMHQRLLKLIDQPDTARHHPVLVNRLRRVRERSRRARSRRRLGN